MCEITSSLHLWQTHSSRILVSLKTRQGLYCCPPMYYGECLVVENCVALRGRPLIIYMGMRCKLNKKLLEATQKKIRWKKLALPPPGDTHGAYPCWCWPGFATELPNAILILSEFYESALTLCALVGVICRGITGPSIMSPVTRIWGNGFMFISRAETNTLIASASLSL